MPRFCLPRDLSSGRCSCPHLSLRSLCSSALESVRVSSVIFISVSFSFCSLVFLILLNWFSVFSVVPCASLKQSPRIIYWANPGFIRCLSGALFLGFSPPRQPVGLRAAGRCSLLPRVCLCRPPQPQAAPRRAHVPTREGSRPSPALAGPLARAGVAAAAALRWGNMRLSVLPSLPATAGTGHTQPAWDRNSASCYGLFSPLIDYKLTFLLINVCQGVYLYNYA